MNASWLRVAAAAALGALLGIAGARYVLVGSGLSLIPWTLLALLVGGLARSRPEAVRDGAGYGFGLAYAFMVAGYDGSAPLAGRLAPFLLFVVFGALCGGILGLLGRGAGALVRRISPVRHPAGSTTRKRVPRGSSTTWT